MKFFKIIKRIFLKISIRFYTPYSVSNFYRKVFGVKIGINCRILDKRLNLFGSEPYLIEIGENVTLTENVKLVTHDGGTAVIRNNNPGLNFYGKICIRDNCFIGTQSIVLPGVTIGPNSVVGAGSVVTKHVPPNTVVAGVPAKIIRSLKNYERKCIQNGIILTSSDTNLKKRIIINSLNDKDYRHNTSDNTDSNLIEKNKRIL